MATTISSSLAKQIQDALANTRVPSYAEFLSDPEINAQDSPYRDVWRGTGMASVYRPQQYQNYLRDMGLNQTGIINNVLQQNAYQAGWEKPEYWENGSLADVWKAPNGHYYISPYAQGSWPGTFDPNTGFIDLGTNAIAVRDQGVANRDAAYTGGDWLSDVLGSIGPALMMGGIGALAAGPAIAALSEAAVPTAAAAAPLAEAAVAPEIAAELSALQASTTGLGSGIGAPSIVEQLVSNLPSVSTMTQNAAINAATQLVTTGKVDPEKVLTSTVTGAVGTTVGATVGNEVLSATDSALASSIANGATKGALTAAITGNDPLQTALASGAASGLGSVAKDAGIDIPQNVINSVVSGIANNQPLNQVLTGAVLAAGTNLAKDAISSAYNAYNADQQTAGLQAASDLGNAPVQGFDNNGNPIYRDSNGVWTNEQGVQVDPATGEPTQVLDTSSVEVTPYKPIESVTGTEIPANQITEQQTLPSDQPMGALPSTQQMPEIVVEDQQPAEKELPAVSLPNVDTTGMAITGGSTGASTSVSTPVSAPVAATIPVASVSGLPTDSTSTGGTSGGTGGSSGTTAASDFSKYVNPIPSYLRSTELSTGAVSQAPALWAGIDPRLAEILTQRAAHGGQIHPRLMKVLHERGGELVPGPENRLYMRHAKRGFAVEGPGTGQSDDIPTMLADSEYVIDADTVAALGDGSSKAGAEVLDKMRMAIRKHKRSAPIDKIPPKAKSPLEYIKEGMKMNHKKK